MSHTAVFPLLTVDRNKFRLSLFVCICEFKTGIMTFSHVYTFFRGTHSIFDFSVAPVVRVKMWGSFTVTAEEELWHGPLCSLCLLSWPSCFWSLNGCSDECSSFYKDPYCGRRGLAVQLAVFSLIFMCTDTNTGDTHKRPWTTEPRSLANTNAVCWLEFSHCIRHRGKVLYICQWCSLWESCEKAFCPCFVCRFLQKHIELYFDHFNKAGLIFFTGSTGCLLWQHAMWFLKHLRVHNQIQKGV